MPLFNTFIKGVFHRWSEKVPQVIPYCLFGALCGGIDFTLVPLVHSIPDKADRTWGETVSLYLDAINARKCAKNRTLSANIAPITMTTATNITKIS